MRVLGVFANATEVRELQPGEVVFAVGDAGNEMYGAIEGAVELTANGRTIATLGPDDVFGEMAIIDESPRMATAVATAPTKVAVVDRRHFLFLVHETPMFALQVMATIADRLRQFYESDAAQP